MRPLSKVFFSTLFINSYLQGLLASNSSWHIILHLSIPGNMRKKQSSWQMLFFDVDAWKGCIIFFTSFLKRSLFSSFFGEVCVCCENRGPVVWTENFSLLHKRERTEMFSQFGTTPTMIKLLKLNRSSQNSLFGQVAGPFQEIISQPHREQDFTVPPIS